jgi:hypothetical protein
MTMRHLSIGDQVTGPDALRCPELHDFSDLSGVVRTNRPLVVALAIAAMLTIGHFAYQGHVAPMDAGVPQPMASVPV